MYSVPILLGLIMAAATPQTSDVEIRLEKLRNERGVLHVCLTREPAHFPDCGKDPAAVKRTILSATGPIRITGMDRGTYALTIFHDENGNGKLDTLLGIPREGFGFSRNPVVRFGPPRFDQVRFQIAAGLSRQTLRMQYLL